MERLDFSRIPEGSGQNGLDVLRIGGKYKTLSADVELHSERAFVLAVRV